MATYILESDCVTLAMHMRHIIALVLVFGGLFLYFAWLTNHIQKGMEEMIEHIEELEKRLK